MLNERGVVRLDQIMSRVLHSFTFITAAVCFARAKYELFRFNLYLIIAIC